MASSSVCQLIERWAGENRLPVAYLSRLLWTESRFNSAATSPVGAAGIAQFMPETAVEQGLRDPRDPASSIAHAARLLVNLHQRFGNLGLAAAAYNAGPGRLGNWLQGSGPMPAETRLYVRLVTGKPLEQWIGVHHPPGSGDAEPSCAAAVAELRRNERVIRTASGPRQLYSFFILSDGNVVSRKTRQSLTASDRLAMHRALSRAVGLPADR